MFGSNKKKDAGKSASNSAAPGGGHSLNSLVEGTSVEGTLTSKSDIRVDGSIKGTLTCDAKVIIGPTGFIEGEVRCQNAVIEGRFEGTLYVKELLNIRESAKVTGDVAYGKLNVASGAVISGSYKVAGTNSNGSSKSANKIVNGAKSSDAKDIAGKATYSKETAN
jgi:cytoskeletal protein CcmA (bactofilin family)